MGTAVDEAVRHRHEFVTLEHLLFALLEDPAAQEVLVNCGADLEELSRALAEYFEKSLEKVPEGAGAMPELTSTFQSTISYAVLQAEGSGQSAVDGGNILASMYQAEQSYAVYLLLQQGVKRIDILNYLSHGISKLDYAGGPLPEGDDEDDEDFLANPAERKKPLESFTVELVAKLRVKLIRSSGEWPRSSAPSRFCAAARRIIRFTSASLAWERQHSPRALP
jgi:ATP-dependent Clp protease ATP-binding subunit ClpA